MSARRILFTCRPLAGHFHPLLPLASAARAAGHEVAFASGEPVVSQAREAGHVGFAAGRPDTFRREWMPRFPELTTLVGDAQREFFFTRIFADLELAPRAADLGPIVDDWHPDLVVHEVAELAAPMVCRVREIPYVDVGYGVRIPRPVLLAAGAAAADHWRAQHLEPDPLAGLFRYLYVDPCPPSLQSPEIAEIGRVQAMRPMEAEPRAGGDEPLGWLDDLPDRPTVYVTLGTIWNTDLEVFQMLIEGVRHHANVIVTVGRQNDPDQLGPQPAGVVVQRYIPQADLLPRCDAVVAHGGAGTMLGALGHGLPMLVLPQGADQWSNAARVVGAGAGRQLLRDEVSAASVSEAVAALLDEPSYRTAAEGIEREIRAMPPVEDVIPVLEALM